MVTGIYRGGIACMDAKSISWLILQTRITQIKFCTYRVLIIWAFYITQAIHSYYFGKVRPVLANLLLSLLTAYIIACKNWEKWAVDRFLDFQREPDCPQQEQLFKAPVLSVHQISLCFLKGEAVSINIANTEALMTIEEILIGTIPHYLLTIIPAFLSQEERCCLRLVMAVWIYLQAQTLFSNPDLWQLWLQNPAIDLRPSSLPYSHPALHEAVLHPAGPAWNRLLSHRHRNVCMNYKTQKMMKKNCWELTKPTALIW